MTSEAQFLRPHLLAMGVTESAVDAVERAWSHRGGSYIDYLEAEGCISMSAARTLKMAVKGYVTTPVSQIIGRLRLPESAPSSEESALVVPPMPASARLAGPSSVDVEARSPREPMEHPASRARHRKSWRELVSNGPQPWLTPPPSSSSTASIDIQRASIAPMAPTPPADSVPAEPAPDHSRAETPPQLRPAPPRIHRFPRLGDQLGRYQLQERLGEGSTAVIYRSYHEALGVPVAVKVFRPEVAGQLDFLSEARTLAKLDHPNIVRVLDVEEAPHAFIVFEFVGAMTLEDLVRATGRLPADRVLELGIEIASGLQAAWRQDVLHRDVKPTNVLVRKDGRAKLVDFGLAVVRSGFESMDPTTACGSPAFMAPEQILHPAEIDHRADMYGLGATLYDAASGEPPILASTPAETLRAQIHELPLPLHERIEGFDLRASRLIHRLLQKKPADRFGSWDEVLELLIALRSQGSRESDRLAPRKSLRRALTSIWGRGVGT